VSSALPAHRPAAPRDIPGKLVQSVFQKVLKDEVDDVLAQDLSALGISLAGPVPLVYPRAVWHAAVARTARQLFEGAPPPVQLRRLGRHLLEVVDRRQLLRGPWVAMARLAGPRRVLRQAADHSHHRDSPLHFRVVDNGRGVDVLTPERDQPEFLAGVLEGLVQVLGGRGAEARIDDGGEELRLQLTWR
jgi:uncharacterized protein (TIGR02265 family)